MYSQVLKNVLALNTEDITVQINGQDTLWGETGSSHGECMTWVNIDMYQVTALTHDVLISSVLHMFQLSVLLLAEVNSMSVSTFWKMGPR